MKHILLLSLFFLTSCATVGPVEVDETDTVFTILTATGLAVLVFVIKGYIEYLFAKRLEKYKKKLEINSK